MESVAFTRTVTRIASASGGGTPKGRTELKWNSALQAAPYRDERRKFERLCSAIVQRRFSGGYVVSCEIESRPLLLASRSGGISMEYVSIVLKEGLKG